MKEDFALKYGFEKHYSAIPRKIIAEKYLATENNDLQDFKLLCFNGEVRFIWVDSGRYTVHRRNIYDINWNLLNMALGESHIYGKFTKNVKPINLNKMIEIATILSKDFYFARVDLYEHNGKIYFCEMTFSSASGIHIFEPSSENLNWGNFIKLPIDNKEIV